MGDPVSVWRTLTRVAQRVARSAWPARLAIVVFLVAAVVSGCRDLQPDSPVHDRFIGHADRANMAVLARNIAEGNGAVVDVVWLLRDGGIPGDGVITPEPYWSVYAATWVAFFFFLFGATQQSMVLAGVVAKVLIAALTGLWTHRLTQQVLPGWSVAILLLVLPRMTRGIDGLSDIYLTLAVLAAGTALCWACGRGGRRAFFVAGLLVGVAIGVKPSGLLLCGTIVGFSLLQRRRHRWLRCHLSLVVGIVLALAPLAWHNYHAFGHLISPANRLVAKAAAIRWLTGNHDLAFYGPEPYRLSETQRESLRLERPLALLAHYTKRLGAGVIVLGPLLPLMPASAFLLWWCWRKRQTPQQDGDLLFVAFALMMLLGGFALGAVLPFEPRYWNFLVPLSTALAFWALRHLWRPLPLLMASFLMFTTFGSLEPPAPSPGIPAVYRKLERLVPRDSVLLTRNPWEVAFHTRRPAVALPYTADERVLLAVARRYRVDHLAILRRSAGHPIYTPLLQGTFPDWLEKVHYERNLAIGRLRHPAASREPQP